jgi:hypothetical protein
MVEGGNSKAAAGNGEPATAIDKNTVSDMAPLRDIKGVIDRGTNCDEFASSDCRR